MYNDRISRETKIRVVMNIIYSKDKDYRGEIDTHNEEHEKTTIAHTKKQR